MKRPIARLPHGKKFLLILGLIVSILAVFKSEMYSTSGLQQYLPDVELVKQQLNDHIRANQQAANTNLSNGNFIASYIHVISNRPEYKDKECDKPSALTTLKNKVSKVFSSI